MAENEKRDDLLREREIEDILRETHYLADREKMERVAQRYRVKPKMDDIYSNTSKKSRLKNESPLDIEDTENIIVGDKNAATMQASMMMDGSEQKVLTPQQAKADAEKRREQKQTEQSVEQNTPTEGTAATEETEETEEIEENEVITLSPQYDDDAHISKDIIDEVEQFDEEEVQIESIDSIDIEIKENSAEESLASSDTQESEVPTEKISEPKKSAKKVVSTVPVYHPFDGKETINVKAGRFSEVVTVEYEEYIRSKNPSVIVHAIRPEQKPQTEEEQTEEDNRSAQEKVLSAVVGFFSKDESDDDDTPHEKTKTVEDYKDEEDEKSIMYELNLNIKKLFMRSVLSGVIAALAVILTFITRIFPEALCSAVAFAPAAYAVLNFVLVGFSLFVNRVAMMSGLTPLLRFKGNSDTAVAVGGVTAMLQTIVSFFCIGSMDSFSINYYCVVVLVAFFANNLGKLFMVLRVKDNFKFVSSKGQKYAAKIYNNETVANQMLSGTPSDKSLIAYQHKTNFPANFLKISYAPDPSEDLASKLAPLTTVAAIIIALLYGAVNASLADAVSALALITAVVIPVSTLIAVNLPIRILCKKLVSFGSMLAGYPSVKQFCDSTAIMIDANELFPSECIELEGIKTYEEYNVDESLLCGIAILKEAQNPIANTFDSVMAETNEKLPEVESVLYEDDMGLVGWVNSERILVGSRSLMEKYSVELPEINYEENYTANGSQVTYLSRAGRLIAMFVTRYHADKLLRSELQRAEANGISFLIRTTDYNITSEIIASKYDLFYRSIKVLPTGLGNVLKEVQSTVEETSRSYLITNGKPFALTRAVSACVRVKNNISLAIVIQLIAVVLGVLLSATLALYAGVGVMGSLEVLIYSLFWGAAAIIAPLVQKP